MSKPIHDNIVVFEVYGDYALFTDPITRIGGEKCTYQIPTYEAIKGILASVYWKPTFIWYIDAVKIMNPIQTEVKGIRPIKYGGGNDLAYYTYLKSVRYQVKAHFEWNDNRPELIGGRRDIFSGTRECQGYVEPCVFDSEPGAYAEIAELSFGLMYHGLTYPDEAYSDQTKEKITANFWYPVMKNGIISFPRPEDCPLHKPLREMKMKEFCSVNEDISEDF